MKRTLGHLVTGLRIATNTGLFGELGPETFDIVAEARERLEIIVDVQAWGAATFDDPLRDWTDPAASMPIASVKGRIEHLSEEVDELKAALADWDPKAIAEELADVLILSYGLANCLNLDVSKIVAEKLAVLKTREWGPPDDKGVRRHVKAPVVSPAEFDEGEG